MKVVNQTKRTMFDEIDLVIIDKEKTIYIKKKKKT